MADNNDQTLKSYSKAVDAYIARTPAEAEGFKKIWIDTALAKLSKKAKILEVGAGYGRRSEYLVAQGFKPIPTDAVDEFVQAMKDRGLTDAYRLDLLKDEIPTGQNLILADAVLLHFDHEEIKLVLTKIRDALGSNGMIAFSVKQGEGEKWVNAKIDAPRFFHYWSQKDLRAILQVTGFNISYLDEHISGVTKENWLLVIASPKNS